MGSLARGPSVPDLARGKRLARGRRGTAIFLICANAGRRETGAVIKAQLKPIGINVDVKAVRNYYEDANTKG